MLSKASLCLSLLCFSGGLTVFSQPIFAENMRTEGIHSQPFSLADWDLASPDQVRFGVVTTIWEKGKYQRSILGRIQKQEPQRQIRQSSNWAPPSNEQDDAFLIASFAHGLPNRLGGGFGAFSKAPSQARVSIQNQAFLLEADKASSGYAGAWIQLMSDQAEQRQYLDASSSPYLSFEAQFRGDFTLKLADRHWHQKDDSLSLGPLASFRVPSPASAVSDWQSYALPLAQIRSLDRSHLASLAFEAIGNGPQQLKLRNLQLSKSPSPVIEPLATSQSQAPALKAIWLWNTADLLKDAQQQVQTLAFLKQQAIERVFLQLPAQAVGLPGEVVFDSVALAGLIRAFHAQGMQVEALEGDPRYAQQPFHAGVLATLERVLKHNQIWEPAARFDGLQYDIEPYLLPGFFGWRREPLLNDYLSLLSQIYRRTQATGLRFGVAIPHWFDQPDEFSGKLNWLDFAGHSKPLHELIQDRSDYLALMDYRTQIWGQAGILAAAFQELDYASRAGKQVLVGLETMDLPDEQLFLLRGKPQRQRPKQNSLVIFRQGEIWQQTFLSADQIWTAPEQVWFWPLQPYAQTAGSDLSFVSSSLPHLQETLAIVNQELSVFKGFTGIALHHTTSYADLVKASK